MKRIFIPMMIGGLCAFHPDIALSAPMKKSQIKDRNEIVIKATKGPVLIRRPGESDWVPIKDGMRLPFETILKVGDLGEVSLFAKGLELTDKNRESRSLVTIQEPTTIRLDHDLFRNVPTTKVFVHKQPKTTAASQEDENIADGVWDDLKERFSLVLSTLNLKPEEAPKTAPQISHAVQHKKLVIFTPEDQEWIQSAQFPYPLKVMWQDVPVKNPRYKIFIWSKEEAQGSPYVYTTATKWEVPIHEYGDYFLQVSTDDDKYQSKPLLIHVATVPRQNKGEEDEELLTKDGENANTSLELTTPEDNWIVVTPKKSMPVEFHWDGPTLDEGSQYHWYLYTAIGKLIDEDVIQRPHVIKNLAPGQYLWAVEQKLITRGDRVHHVASERRRITIENSNLTVDKLIERAMSSSSDQSLVIDTN